MHNHVTLLGNVGGTIQLRQVDDTRFARFTLATDRVWRDGEGNRHEATDWHLCTLFGGTVDAFAERVAKGSLLFVEGSLRSRSYDKDGERRYVTEVRVSRWQVLPQGNGKRSDPAADASTPDDSDSTPEPTPDDLPADDAADLEADPSA